MQNCKGKTKTGAPCRAPAGSGGLCFLHANPNAAQKLGRIGGLKNRRLPVDLEVPDNPSAADIWKMNGQAMKLLLAGELGAREASAFSQLSNSMSRVIPIAELENRIAILEEQLTQDGQAAHDDAEGIASDSTAATTCPEETAEPDVPEQAERDDRRSVATIEEEEPDPNAFATIEDGEGAENTSDGSSEEEGEP